MTLLGITDVINSILEEDRRKFNIEGKYLFKVEESIWDDKLGHVNTTLIRIRCTFNNYNFITVQHKFFVYKKEEEFIDEKKEEVRYLFLRDLLTVLKYGKGELDYNLFLNDTYTGYKDLNNDKNIT